ncbi:putative ankyrin repeat protein [Powai lake megavirus]|uniref:Putative ankyrin repeat protein n=1 Tax=Powai lake megavirus TaxID=1842663 RepID=A0A167RDD3_9VIRU|nr:putative ankyrin repeat protein [Powai lake megavirus]ANB50557.1 putative ankyrin repeat protein [Powai lake megavirus]
MEEDKIYLKVLKNSRIHNGLKYTKGYNEIKNFVETGSCVPGRIYFCDPNDKSQNICRYLHYGDILVDITLPIHDPDFKMIIDPSGGKSASNKIIIGRERCLSDPKTFEYMASCGVDITKNYVLKWALDNNYWNVVLYLITTIPLTSSRLGLIEHKLISLAKKIEFTGSTNYKELNIIESIIIDINDFYVKLINHHIVKNNEIYVDLIKIIKFSFGEYKRLIKNYGFKFRFMEIYQIISDVISCAE